MEARILLGVPDRTRGPDAQKVIANSATLTAEEMDLAQFNVANLVKQQALEAGQ